MSLTNSLINIFQKVDLITLKYVLKIGYEKMI